MIRTVEPPYWAACWQYSLSLPSQPIARMVEEQSADTTEAVLDGPMSALTVVVCATAEAARLAPKSICLENMFEVCSCFHRKNFAGRDVNGDELSRS